MKIEKVSDNYSVVCFETENYLVPNKFLDRIIPLAEVSVPIIAQFQLFKMLKKKYK